MLPWYLAEIGFQYFILVNIYYISSNGVFVMVLISVLDNSNNNLDIYVNILYFYVQIRVIKIYILERK